MDATLVQGLLFPLFILLIEYLVIQPWLRYQESRSFAVGAFDTKTNGRSWGDGIRHGIKQFKQHTNQYNWGGLSIKQHFVAIEGFSISRGQAQIFLVVKVRYLLDKQRPVGGYRIVIDRVGDISEFETVAIQENPFEDQDVPFPKSWLAIGFILFVVFLLRLISSIPSALSPDINGGTPVPVNEWSSLAIPMVLDTPINGTIGSKEKDIYSFKTTTNGKVKITLTRIGSFQSVLAIYDENGSRIESTFINRSEGSIEIAPEMNENYLIVVASSLDGGSYVLAITLSE
jgi:hypothetical protein